jgi:tRNA U34 2-thiouridine synthase MnmA/TrmU
MNKEPVAYVDNVWINRPDLAMDLGIGQMFSRCQLSDHQIPLYTHPAKTLTDEEITDIASTLLIATDSIEYEWGVCVVEFAKAILRKAQE